MHQEDKHLSETTVNLHRLHDGDEQGLEALLEQHLPWLRRNIRIQLTPFLRKKGDSSDYLQDAMVQFLQYAPRFTITDEARFRGLLMRVIKNVLCNKYDFFMAKRRMVARERPLGSDTVLNLDPPRRKEKTPSKLADQREREAWVRMGLELLDPEDREIILLRRWDGLGFAEIGELLEVKTDAARMRHNRAVSRLSEMVWKLRTGDLVELEEPAP